LPHCSPGTHRREVSSKVGGFGGLFALGCEKISEQFSSMSVDGVATKAQARLPTLDRPTPSARTSLKPIA